MIYGSDSSLSFYSCETNNSSFELSSMNYSLDKSLYTRTIDLNVTNATLTINRPVAIGDCSISHYKEHPSLIFDLLDTSRLQMCDIPRPSCIGQEDEERRTVRFYEDESDLSLVSEMPDNISSPIIQSSPIRRSILSRDSDSSLFLKSSLCKLPVKQKLSWKKMAKKFTQKLKFRTKGN